MSGAGVTVRWGRLDEHRADRFEPLLCAGERERAASFRFARDRERFVVARGLLRTLLGECLGQEPGRIRFAYGERGKPRLAGAGELRFNLSHSRDVVAIALSEGREVGIDVEARREFPRAEGIARRFLPPAATGGIDWAGKDLSRDFFRTWVRQEAYAKGCGAGLAAIGVRPSAWTLADLELPNAYAGAVAVEGTTRLRVRMRPI